MAVPIKFLICFAVKEEAAPFRPLVADRPDIRSLVSGGFTGPGGSKNIGCLESNDARDTTFLGSADNGIVGSGVVMVRLLTEPVIPRPNVPAGSFVRQLDGQFRISLNSILTSAVVLEGSTDLLNWPRISTNTVVNGTVTLNDANAGNFNGRYYRTVQK